MKYLKTIAILGMAFYVGCASKPPTSQEKIANLGRSFEETEEQLLEAERKLKAFDENIASLRASASGADRMRTKPGFDAALSRLSSRIEQTHYDLQELKTANARSRNVYERQLEEAASKMQDSAREPIAE